MTRWPSGLRCYVKAVVFTGVDSNPTRVNFLSIPSGTRISFSPGSCESSGSQVRVRHTAVPSPLLEACCLTTRGTPKPGVARDHYSKSFCFNAPKWSVSAISQETSNVKSNFWNNNGIARTVYNKYEPIFNHQFWMHYQCLSFGVNKVSSVIVIFLILSSCKYVFVYIYQQFSLWFWLSITYGVPA